MSRLFKKPIKPFKIVKVLIVDDEILYRDGISTLLNKYLPEKDDYLDDKFKIEILTADSGENALKILQQHQIGIMFSDVIMPGMNGLELVNKIRNELNNHEVQIILLTGQPDKLNDKDVIEKFDIDMFYIKGSFIAPDIIREVLTKNRTYQRIMKIKEQKQEIEEKNNLIETQNTALRNTIDGVTKLLKWNSITMFAQEFSSLFISVFKLKDNVKFIFASRDNNVAPFKKLIVKGKFDPGFNLDDCLNLLQGNSNHISPTLFLNFYESINKTQNLIYVEEDFTKNETLILTFFTFTNLIYDFVSLNKDIIYILKDILQVLMNEKSQETVGHQNRVGELCYHLALKSNMSIEEAENLKLFAPLHDIGKMLVPDHILKKPGKFEKDELIEMNKHPEHGRKIMREVKDFFGPIIQMIYEHHERADGNGYPKGKKDDEIHLYAKVLHIIDCFEACMSPRYYKPSLTPEEVKNIISKGMGTDFNKELTEIFLANYQFFVEIWKEEYNKTL